MTSSVYFDLPVSSVPNVEDQEIKRHKNPHERQSYHSDKQSLVDSLLVVSLYQLVSGQFTSCNIIVQ